MESRLENGSGAQMQRRELLALIHQSALWMRSSADFPGAVEQALVGLRRAGLTFDTAVFHLVDDDLAQTQFYTLWPAPVDWGSKALAADRAEARACLTLETQMWNEDEDGGQRWFLAVPGVVGAVCVADRRAQGFTAGERALVEEVVCALETLVVRQQDLHALEMARARVTRIDTDLLALYDGSYDLSGETQDEVAQTIIQRVTGTLGFDRAGIFLVDRGHDELRGAWGTDEEGQVVAIPQTVFPLHPDDPNQVTETARLANGERDYFLTQDLDGQGMRSVEGDIRASLSVPMRVGNRIVGVLAVDNYMSDRPIRERLVQPLMILANQGAVALENARLHQMRGVVESLGEGLLVVDREGRVLHANAHLVELTGFAREDWVGRLLDGCPIRLHEESGEVELPRRDGTPVWVEVRIGPYHDIEGEPIGSLVRVSDIDRRKRAEIELEEQRSRFVRSDRLRSLGEMAAGIAHELNQPLVGVRGLAEHLLIGMERGWKLDAVKLQQRLEGIVEQADRMVHIIEHVRKFAREAGRPELAAVPVNEVVQSALDLLQVQFRSHGLELDAELGEELPLVQANPYSLEEVVLNLLSNARDATEERFGEDAGSGERVEVRTGVEDGWVRIAVADSGVGIPSGVAERVFEPFFTTKDPDRGTGLGLSISKGIVEEFGGRLELASVEGEGTTVTICLPATPEPDA